MLILNLGGILFCKNENTYMNVETKGEIVIDFNIEMNHQMVI